MKNIESFLTLTNFIIGYSGKHQIRFRNERFKIRVTRFNSVYVIFIYETVGAEDIEFEQTARSQKEIIKILNHHANFYKYSIKEVQ